MRAQTNYVDELLKAVDTQSEDLPEEVEGAINDLLVNIDENDASVPWYKAPFATVANVLVLAAYVLSLFKGTVIGPWTVPEFDATAAFAIMGIANGTYVVNRLASAKENGGG